MEVIVNLITQYGWQAVLVAVLALAFVEIFKPLIRKGIKSESGRHTLYTVISYVSALGFTAALAAILHRIGDLFNLYGSVVIVLGILTPVVINTGFIKLIEDSCGALWAKLSENGAWKKVIKELGKKFGIDESILDTVATKIETEYKPFIDAGAQAFFTGNKEELVLNIKQKLAGFVENGELQSLAESLYTKLAESWKVKFEDNSEAVK